jgi:hypothetical protein
VVPGTLGRGMHFVYPRGVAGACGWGGGKTPGVGLRVWLGSRRRGFVYRCCVRYWPTLLLSAFNLGLYSCCVRYWPAVLLSAFPCRLKS